MAENHSTWLDKLGLDHRLHAYRECRIDPKDLHDIEQGYQNAFVCEVARY